MSKKILFLSLLFLPFISVGQKIHFTDSSNHWKVLGRHYTESTNQWHYPNYTFSFVGQQQIDSFSYRRLVSPLGNFFFDTAYIREDTIAETVFFRRNASSPEFPLYQYNISEGDTVNLFLQWNNFVDSTNQYSVTKIDTVLINSLIHRRFFVRNIPNDYFSFSYLEGVGCLSGPVYSASPCFETDFTLQCFRNENGYPYFSTPREMCGFPASWLPVYTNDSTCIPIFSGINNLPVLQSFSLPNPATPRSALTFTTATNGTIHIYDLAGRIIHQENFRQQERLPIGSWLSQPGLYFYSILVDEGRESFRGKVVFEN